MSISRTLAITFLLLGTVLYFVLMLSAMAEADFSVNFSLLNRMSERNGFKKSLRENFLVFIRVHVLYLVLSPVIGLIACSFKVFLQQICEAVFFISYIAVLNRAGIVFNLESYLWDLDFLSHKITESGYSHYINELMACMCVLFVVRLLVLMTFIPCHKQEREETRRFHSEKVFLI